jgi:uncharacterized protein YecE (DUF72 family)
MKESLMTRQNDFDPDRYLFRGLHPNVALGTASDRYAGWMGQIYSADRYEGKISRRTKKMGRRSFVEEVLPVESVEEYFEHFRILEIDYTFYRLLLDEKGEATRNFHVLRTYRERLSSGDQLILKVPQTVFARKTRSGKGYVENPDYLDPHIFVRSFYQPAVELLGENLKGFIFEQEYQRKGERTSIDLLAEDLRAFFAAVPRDERYHIELRTEAYLEEPVFEVLEQYGIGRVLSHWTWLPPLEKQHARAGRRFFNSGGQAVIRLMTPIGKRYEDAYAQAHPFDKLVEGMLQPGMVEQTAKLMRESIDSGVQMNVIVNNRAGGNAPLIAQRIANRFLAESSSGA